MSSRALVDEGGPLVLREGMAQHPLRIEVWSAYHHGWVLLAPVRSTAPRTSYGLRGIRNSIARFETARRSLANLSPRVTKYQLQAVRAVFGSHVIEWCCVPEAYDGLPGLAGEVEAAGRTLQTGEPCRT